MMKRHNPGSKKILLLLPVLLCFALLPLGCARKAPPQPAAVSVYGMNTAQSSGRVLVRRGDTVWSIAQRYRANPEDVIAANNLRPPYHLAAGQRLRLPKPAEYEVREQDTLYSISRMFHIDTHQLVRLNNMQPPYRITAGERLRLPSSGSTASVQTASTQARHSPTVQSDTFLPPAGQAAAIEREDLAQTARMETAALHRPQENNRLRSPQAPQNLANPSPAAAPRAAATPPAASSAQSGFIWPVRGQILSDFGPKPGGLHNDGVNIGAPQGTPVKAAAEGTVVYVGDELASFGNLVLIRHGNGWVSAYGHLQNMNVKRGDTVRQGQTIGTVGRTGSVSTPQLHFELRQGRTALNPARHLS